MILVGKLRISKIIPKGDLLMKFLIIREELLHLLILLVIIPNRKLYNHRDLNKLWIYLNRVNLILVKSLKVTIN